MCSMSAPELRVRTLAFRREPLAVLARARDAGDATWLRLGRQRLLVLSHPDLIEDALVTQARALTKEKVLWGGWSQQLVQRQGPGTIGSEDWTVHTQSRRRVQPAFAPARLDGLRPAVREAALELVDSWPVGELWPAMRRYAIAVFCASMLGTKLDDGAVGELDGRLTAALASYAPVSSAGVLAVTLVRRRRLARAVEASAVSRRWLGGLIAASEAGGDGLPATLHTGDLDPEAAAHDAFTILLAAVDTSASMLGWLGCLLATDAGLCERLAAEWAAADEGRGPLPLAAAAVQEVLRLYPASWFVARSVAAPATVAGIELAPETTVVASPYVVQRDRRWYDEPDRFDPDRWTAAPTRPKFAFFPFGGGVRQCPGERLARIEGELLAGALAARLSLAPLAALPRPRAAASLRFRDPVRLAARRR
jgi:cytochrome P450